MTFRVQILEAATEEPRGFLSVEDDENPNNNVKVAEYDSVGEAQAAIGDEVNRDRIAAREFAYAVVEESGDTVLTMFYDEVYKHWVSFH